MSIDAMQQALKALESINEMSKPPMNIPLAAEIDGAMDALRKAIREAALDGLAETSQEIEPWNTSDMAHRSGGLSVEQAERKPVKSYTGGEPQYATDAPKREWQGLTDEEVAAYSDMFNGIRLMKAIEALLKRRNNG
jgi:hypothetical protein